MLVQERKGPSGDFGSGSVEMVTLTIPAKPEYIVLCRLALAGIGRIRELDPEFVGDLKLALTEACTNSIRHAYAERIGHVEVRFALGEQRVMIEVVDQGVGFDSQQAVALDSEPEGGLGIAIIRALVDELTIGSDTEGSHIRFTKLIP